MTDQRQDPNTFILAQELTGLVPFSPNCSIPDDHIDPRRLALFMARSILAEVLEGAKRC